MFYAMIGAGFVMGWAILACLLRIEKLIKLQLHIPKNEKYWGWGKHK